MMTEKELIERDQKRDLGAELLESVRQMKAGQRAQEWEQGRKKPSGAQVFGIAGKSEPAEIIPIKQKIE